MADMLRDRRHRSSSSTATMGLHLHNSHLVQA
jgi:hypothetical protein